MDDDGEFIQGIGRCFSFFFYIPASSLIAFCRTAAPLPPFTLRGKFANDALCHLVVFLFFLFIDEEFGIGPWKPITDKPT